MDAKYLIMNKYFALVWDNKTYREGIMVNTAFLNLRFENGVNLYGSQAYLVLLRLCTLFENGVNLYGSQAEALGGEATSAGLRMV